MLNCSSESNQEKNQIIKKILFIQKHMNKAKNVTLRAVFSIQIIISIYSEPLTISCS